MYAITGATGHTGGRIAEKLLEAGAKVRVIGRSAERLAPLGAKAADWAVGDLSDAVFLTKAFSGATAVYTMIPPDIKTKNFRVYQDTVGESIATALREAGVLHVVNLSSLGAELSEGTGPIAGLHAQEERLNALDGVNVLHLRPGYFMENHLASIGMIKTMGMNGSAIGADLPIAMIAARDIGDYAAKRLLALDFSGKSVQELLGERDLTLQEATAVLGKAIGKPNLSYQAFPYAATKQALVALGLSGDLAKLYVEMSRAFNEGRITSGKRTKDNTTPTSIERFAEEFAAAFAAA